MGRRDYLKTAIIAAAAIAAISNGLFLAPRLSSELPPASTSANAITPFIYTFNATSTLQEAGSPSESTSPYWWVNAGGAMLTGSGIGSTMLGDTPLTNRWYYGYRLSNPIDTDAGAHPQNIFRLVSKNTWNNVRLQAQFKIVKDNLSLSPNRNASNGLLFMSRYVDSQTLYYAGIRVDGTAVIKKKYRGTYYTMTQKKIFAGTYNSLLSPNLLPHDEWIGLRSETTTNAGGSVTIRLYAQRAGETSWTLVAEATDDGKKYGGTPVITGTQRVGIRTDFMDVLFRGYRAEETATTTASALSSPLRTHDSATRSLSIRDRAN